MPVSPVDAILQIAVPSRPVDPAPRREVESTFRPALEKAYSSTPTRSEPARREEPEEPIGPPQEQPTASRDAREQEPAEADDQVEPAVPHDEQERDKSDDAGDAVEISEEAASAANGQPAGTKEKAEDAALQAAILVEQTIASGEQAGAESDAAEKQGKSEKAVDEATAGEASATVPSEIVLPEAGEASEDNTSKDVQATRAATRVDSAKNKATAEDRKQFQPAQVKPRQLNNEADQQESGGDETSLAKEGPLTTPGASDQSETQDASAPKDDRQETGREKGIRQAEAAPVVADPVIPETETSSGALQSADDPALRRVDGANNNSPTSPARGAAALDRLAARSLRTSERSSSLEGNGQIDRPRFVQRVEGAIRAAQQRDGRVQVRLSPPELGNLRIELAVQNGVLTAKLEAETPAARNTLLDNLPALRDRLAQQEIRVEKFEVDIRRDMGGSGGSGGPQDGRGDQSPSDRHDGRGKPATTSAAVMRPTPRRAQDAAVTEAGLDVSI